MSVTDEPMSIGQVAARAGVATSRIRYYERIGVLPDAERSSGRRRYGEEALRRLAVVQVAQRAGLSLAEIRQLTGPGADARPAGERLRALAERKLPEVDALIERAEAVRRWLAHAAGCACPSVEACALFTDPALAPPGRMGGAGFEPA